MQTRLSTSHRASDTARGFVALVGVFVLAGGVPLALISWVGWPLPAEMPTFSEVKGALQDTYIPDEFLVKALALVCWLIWVELIASLLVETVAYVRGRRAGPVPLAGGVQKAAARLVATVALLGALVSTKGLPDAFQDQRKPLVLLAQPVPSEIAPMPADPSAPIGVSAAAPAALPPPSYEVQRRDTLWDIAERHLGDPFRWPEIFEINKGCEQADGRCLTDPDMIHPGWRLDLPGDAIGVPIPQGAATGGSGTPLPRTTKPGDATPTGTSTPVAPPSTASNGMELIDEGDVAPNAAGEPVLIADSSATRPEADGSIAYDPDAMVLLPEED